MNTGRTCHELLSCDLSIWFVHSKSLVPKANSSMNCIYTSSSHPPLISQSVHIITVHSLFTLSSPRNQILKLWWVRKYQIIYSLLFDVQLTSVSFFFSAVSSSLSSSWSLESCGSILKYKHKQLLTEFSDTSVKSCKLNQLGACFYS